MSRFSGAVGVSVAVRNASSYATVAGTPVPSEALKVKLEDVTVAGSSEREKAALGWTVGLTPVAPSAGVLDVTVGGTGAVVVNVHENGADMRVPSAAATVEAIVAL